jgi:hypothetical protein
VRPDDLLSGRHPARIALVGPVHARHPSHRFPELAPADGEDAAAPADLFFFGGQRNRLVRFLLRFVRQPAGNGIEAERVAVLRVGDGVRALNDVQPEVEAVASEDVAHVVAAHDHDFESGFIAYCFQAGGAHLARRSDRETIARDDEVLTAPHPLTKFRHQVAEGASFPLFVERLEALGYAVGRRGDLVGVDRVQLLGESRAGEAHRIPENQRSASDELVVLAARLAATGQRLQRDAGLQTRGFEAVHTTLNASEAAPETIEAPPRTLAARD